MARKTSEDERLDDASIEKVISLLEAEKPCTKKDACAILNISYNTARLEKILAQFKERKEAESKRRAEKRGKPASVDEVNYVVTEYLEGKPIETIANGIYRGRSFVLGILAKFGVPERSTSPNYFKPKLIPEEAIRKEFKVGEKVYSARYDSMATVFSENKTKNNELVYRIWLDDEKWQQFCYQPVWELASLQHLRDKGVNI